MTVSILCSATCLCTPCLPLYLLCLHLCLLIRTRISIIHVSCLAFFHYLLKKKKREKESPPRRCVWPSSPSKGHQERRGSVESRSCQFVCPSEIWQLCFGNYVALSCWLSFTNSRSVNCCKKSFFGPGTYSILFASDCWVGDECKETRSKGGENLDRRSWE